MVCLLIGIDNLTLSHTKWKLLFLISVIYTVAPGCHPKDKNCPKNSHNGLTIENRSTHRIRHHFYWNFPDTTIGDYNPKFDGSDGLSQGESFIHGADRGTCWESVFSDGRKEWIYFFDADSLNNIDWNTVRITNRGLLARKLLNLDYLKQNDFTVVYP
jgi:hypothetical protein